MPIPKSKSPFARATGAPRLHDNDNPLWAGPCGDGPLGGITQSMLCRFLSCRERFRLKYVLGLEPHDKWNHRVGYGNMWHAMEEALAKCDGPCPMPTTFMQALTDHTDEQLRKYPMQREEIAKWYGVARVQFPEYVRYWWAHPDVAARTPLLQEQVFDVPYHLPSGRVVRLRGKWDSVDLITSGKCNCDYEEGNDWQHSRAVHSSGCPAYQLNGIYLQENKTKGDIDKVQLERQLRFDLQTMMYIVALQAESDSEPRGNITTDREHNVKMGALRAHRVAGVRYNVVRRPLSGGIGSIKPHAEKRTEPTYSKKDGRVLKEGKYTPAETDEQFFERLRRDYIAADPGYWFFRVRAEISERDVQVFRDTCLDPLLEQVCVWYDQTTSNLTDCPDDYPYVPMNYRTPFGGYSALEEGGATEYDAFLETGSEVGLRRTDKLFTELEE